MFIEAGRRSEVILRSKIDHTSVVCSHIGNTLCGARLSIYSYILIMTCLFLSKNEFQRPLHHTVWQPNSFISIHVWKMALNSSAATYFALLSLIVSVVPGLFWLYRKVIRPRKSGENGRQEIRSCTTPTYHNARQSPPTYFYLEESRSPHAWILLQGVPANTPYQLSPILRRMPSHSIAALDNGSQVVNLFTIFLNTYIHSHSS